MSSTNPYQFVYRPLGSLFALLALFLLAACQPVTSQPAAAPSNESGATLVLATHDAFAASEELLKEFEQQNNVKLQVLSLGDVGAGLNQLILSKDAPLADLYYGVDNTFLSRAIASAIFDPYTSPALGQIPDELKLDPEHRLLPVDVGYINLNADKKWFADKGLALPQTLEDLTKPEYKGLLVVENPATSSPGLAFLLVTISHFGEDGYLDFWQALRGNDVLVANGWSEAYYNHFTVGSAGSGDRPLVVSYTSSPPADVLFATDGRSEPASVNISPAGGVWRQVEFVGILKGTKARPLAEKFVDFMLSERFQQEMPLQMFVYPAHAAVTLPELFGQFAEIPSEPAEIDPAAIDANREAWIEAWTNTVLR